jgi:hypothetical protein
VVSPAPTSPDGSSVVALDPEGHVILVHPDGRPPERLSALAEGQFVVTWLDATHMLVRLGTTTPARLAELDLTNGHLTPWHDVPPPSSLGEVTVNRILLTPDRRTFVYSVSQNMGDLYLVTGLR